MALVLRLIRRMFQRLRSILQVEKLTYMRRMGLELEAALGVMHRCKSMAE